MNFIINKSEEKNLADTVNFLNSNNYKIISTGNVSVAIVFIKSHNDLMDDNFKKIIYKYINDKTPYVLVSQTQTKGNIKINYLNTFLNLKIDVSPFFDDYGMILEYIKEVDELYKKLFNKKQIDNASKRVKLNIRKSQEKVQNEIEFKIRKLQNILDE